MLIICWYVEHVDMLMICWTCWYVDNMLICWTCWYYNLAHISPSRCSKTHWWRISWAPSPSWTIIPMRIPYVRVRFQVIHPGRVLFPVTLRVFKIGTHPCRMMFFPYVFLLYFMYQILLNKWEYRWGSLSYLWKLFVVYLFAPTNWWANCLLLSKQPYLTGFCRIS